MTGSQWKHPKSSHWDQSSVFWYRRCLCLPINANVILLSYWFQLCPSIPGPLAFLLSSFLKWLTISYLRVYKLCMENKIISQFFHSSDIYGYFTFWFMSILQQFSIFLLECIIWSLPLPQGRRKENTVRLWFCNVMESTWILFSLSSTIDDQGTGAGRT